MQSAGWFDTYNSITDRYPGHPKQTHKISWSNFIYVAIVQVMNTEYRFRLSETSSHLAPFHTHTHSHTYMVEMRTPECVPFTFYHMWIDRCEKPNWSTTWKHAGTVYVCHSIASNSFRRIINVIHTQMAFWCHWLSAEMDSIFFKPAKHPKMDYSWILCSCLEWTKKHEIEL